MPYSQAELTQYYQQYEKANDVLREIGFVHFEPITQALMEGWIGANSERDNGRNNVLLYGPAGFGKSDITRAFFEALVGEKPAIVSVRKTMDIPELFGGRDLAEAQSSGRRILNTRDSFIHNKVVILEEGLDGNAAFLAGLKLMITDKIVHESADKPKINTKLFIIATNKPPQAISGSPEIDALLERFSIKQLVDWGHIDKIEYFNGMKKILEDNLEAKSYVALRKKLAEIAAHQSWSPGKMRSVAVNITATTALQGKSEVDDFVFLSVAARHNFKTDDMAQALIDEKQKEAATGMAAAFDMAYKQYYNKVRDYRDRLFAVGDGEQAIAEIFTILDSFAQVANNIDQTMREIVGFTADVNQYGRYGHEMGESIRLELSKLLDSMVSIKKDAEARIAKNAVSIVMDGRSVTPSVLD